MAEPAEILAAIDAPPDRRPAARRPAGAGHQRPDPRADRPGALSSRTIPRASRATRSPPRSPRSAPRPCWFPGRRRSRPRPGSGWSRSRPRRRCWRPARRRCRSMSRSWRRPSPTGGSRAPAGQKLKKDGRRPAGAAPRREPGHPRDASPRRGNDRPALVIGFAAETENVVANARRKAPPQGLRLDPRQRRVARHRHLRRRQQHDPPGRRATGSRTGRSMTKTEVAARLAERIASTARGRSSAGHRLNGPCR